MTTHWHAPPKPATISIDLRIEAVVSPSPLWCRRPACAGETPAPQELACRPPLDFGFPPARVISIPIAHPAVQVRSFVFPDISNSPPHLAEGQGATALTRTLSQRERGLDDRRSTFSHTRIKPPSDVIKLADRLHYLLQPTLESLLAEGALAFPFRPFPFQFEGVAFLYPRQAAILGRRNGARQDDAGHHRHASVAASRPGTERAAGVPQAAGDELAAGVRRLVARVAGDGRRGRSGQTPVAMATARRPAANRQLRVAATRSRIAGRPAFRPGRARRIATDQEPRQFDQRGRVFDFAQAQLGADGHAGRKQRRRPAWASSISSPPASFRPR